MVYLAGAAYCDGSALESWTCGEACQGPLGVAKGSVTVITDESLDLQAYVARLADGRRLVSFRGTRPSHLQDWIDDLKSAFLTDYTGANCPGCKVADGFYKAYIALSAKMAAALDALGSGPVAITGHSLGAALAGYAAFDLKSRGYDTTSSPQYTFGMPRDGDKAYSDGFAAYVGASSFYRVVHHADIVPHLPSEFMGFHHIPREVWYTENSTSYRVCDGSGEDPNCSDSLLFPVSVSDHLHYLNIPISGLCNA